MKECFPGGSVVKSPPANAGDMGLIPGLGRSPREGNGQWEILWTEEPVRLWSLGLQRVGYGLVNKQQQHEGTLD